MEKFDLERIKEDLVFGRKDKVVEGIKLALEQGYDVRDILDKGLIAGMNIVGDKFKRNEFYIPEVLLAARAMKAGMEVLTPLIVSSDVKPLGRVVIGTVKGDLHDIGKNLVATMLQGGGFEVIDLGVNVPAERFVKVAAEKEADLVCMSALLTTTMVQMEYVIKELESAGLRNRVKVMVGGAPVTQEFAEKIGADGYGEDAAVAVEKARELISRN